MNEFFASSEFLSALLGAASALIVLVLGAEFKRRRERASIRAAFEGEIRAILNLIQIAKVTSNMEAVISQSGYGLNYKTWPSVSFDLQVWSSNAEKIGLLNKEAASQVAYFYTMHSSALSMLKENENHELVKVNLKDGKPDYSANRVIRENLYGAWQSLREMERVGNDYLERRSSENLPEYPTL